MVEIKEENVATEVAWEVSTAETPENTTVTDAPEWDINMTMSSDATDNSDDTEEPEKENKEDKKEKKDKKDKEKKEEKTQIVPSKEKICEFYGIRDEEILDKEFDLSKYGITKQEKATLKEWADEKMKKELKDVSLDMFELDWHPNAAVIVERYWVQPHHVVEDKLEDLWLSKEEVEVIKKFYDAEVLRLYKKVNHLED